LVVEEFLRSGFPQFANLGFFRQMSIIDVAAALVFRKGKLLITQRFSDDHLGGLWEFPGGKREEGESFEDCLRRELDEELRIQVYVYELVEAVTHAYHEKTVHLRFFRCEWRCSEPVAVGCADFKWVSAMELKQYDFPAADAQLLEKLENTPALWGERADS
jgi:mutator protein MutT